MNINQFLIPKSIGFLVILIIGGLVYYSVHQKPAILISTFEECVAEGNPIMESYPPQCVSRDGKHFVEDVGNAMEKNNLIRITYPLPNTQVSSPLRITGEARGTWYFEASFPVVLVDWDGKIIAQGVAQAQRDWMTTDFVPFEAILTFRNTDITGQYSNKATLILKKDNPSGLPEYDDALEIPVRLYSQREINIPLTLQIGKQITLSDGLVLMLKEINDSRCKAEVTCIWQGELSAVFVPIGNGFTPGEEVRLGTERTPTVKKNGYTFTLEGATETSATVRVQ